MSEPALTRAGRLPAAICLLLLALWLVVLAPWRPLMLPDEGRYVGVAWEMLGSGDWLTPTLHGLPYFHKPPLMYWLTAGAMGLFGPGELAARAAPLIGAWFMGLASWLWWLKPGRLARLTLAVLATLPFFAIGGQFANHDMLVAGWISMAIVAGWRAMQADAATRWRWSVLMWGMAGLALLSKGLIGFVIPALVVAPWWLARRGWRGLAEMLHPGGIALFLLLVGPWMLAMQRQHPGFFDYFIVEQHFRRFTQATFNNQHPVWFYLAVLPLLCLPASLCLLPALARWRHGPWRRALPLGAGFAAWWVLVVVGFFSLPASKLVGYVLPALPPLAWACAQVLGRASPRTVGALLVSAALVCVAAVGGLAVLGPRDHTDLGRTLAAQWQLGDRLAYVEAPFFDLRLLARKHVVPAVIDPWDPTQIAREDNWRKEIFDAARFAPARGAAVMWKTGEAWQQRCAPGRIWLALPPGEALPPGYEDATLVQRGDRGDLLRVAGPAPGRACDGLPR